MLEEANQKDDEQVQKQKEIQNLIRNTQFNGTIRYSDTFLANNYNKLQMQLNSRYISQVRIPDNFSFQNNKLTVLIEDLLPTSSPRLTATCPDAAVLYSSAVTNQEWKLRPIKYGVPGDYTNGGRHTKCNRSHSRRHHSNGNQWPVYLADGYFGGDTSMQYVGQVQVAGRFGPSNQVHWWIATVPRDGVYV